MGNRKVMMGNHAVSYGAMLARTQVIAAYPITPQTQVVEELSEICADGNFITVDSRILKSLKANVASSEPLLCLSSIPHFLQ